MVKNFIEVHKYYFEWITCDSMIKWRKSNNLLRGKISELSISNTEF